MRADAEARRGSAPERRSDAAAVRFPNGMHLADIAFPQIGTPAEYEALMPPWLDALRLAGTAQQRPDLELLARRKCGTLGLPEGALAEHLRHGLRQLGALGPDEMDEYHRNLERLFGRAPGAPPELGIGELLGGLSRLADELCERMQPLVQDEHTTPVFLGTDAEYQKLVFDVLAGGSRASRLFYVSRMTLMTEEEFRPLWETKEAVFGAAGKTRTAADGSRVSREYSWMDNSLVSAVTYQIIHRVRDAGAPSSEVVLQRIGDAILAELIDQPLQRRMLAEGMTTFFGASHPRVDAVIGEGIRRNRFASVVVKLVGRLCGALGEADAEGASALVDLGASGTQPLLLAGSVRALASAATADLRGVEALRPLLSPEGDLPAQLRAASRGLSIRLFCPRPGDWPNDGGPLQSRKASWAFATAVETMKTVKTSYDGESPDLSLKKVSATQELLAYLKQLVFRDAARARADAAGTIT